MIAHGKSFLRSLFILFSGIAGAPAWGVRTMPENNVLRQVESKVCRRLHRMKKGFGGAQGYFKAWPIEECYRIFRRAGLCYGNNPVAPPSRKAKRPIRTRGIIGGASWASSFEANRIMIELVHDRPSGVVRLLSSLLAIRSTSLRKPSNRKAALLFSVLPALQAEAGFYRQNLKKYSIRAVIADAKSGDQEQEGKLPETNPPIKGGTMSIPARAHFFCFFLVLMGVTGWSSDCGAAPKNREYLSSKIERTTDRVIEALVSQGFEVSQGYFRLYTLDDCQVSFSVMQSCYGNNPAAPYVTFAVLPWDEEYLDPATRNAIGLLEEGYTGTFRFDPKEAILVFGRMPPPAAYFGLQTYLFTREGSFDTGSETYQWIAWNLPKTLDSFFSYVPENTDRIQMFASIGNSNNKVIVKEQVGSAFNQERFFISTPDQRMDEAVRSALAEAAIDPRRIFTEPIPSTKSDGSDGGMKVGLDAQADEFLFVMRYAMPNDGGGPGSRSAKWQEELPLTVLRVRDTSGRQAQPYDLTVLDERSAVDESPLEPELMKLAAAVNERWGQPCVTDDCSDRAGDFIDLQGSEVNLVGPECTKIGMNCIGDGQDSSYQMTTDFLLDTGYAYAVAGTLGTRTGNATYVGLSVNDSYLIKGVANIDSDQLRNTASAYAADLTNPSKFYLYYLARDCAAIGELTDGNCFAVTEDMLPVCTDLDDPDCHPLKLLQRNYISKGTARGPDSTLLLPPKLIPLKLP